MSLIFFKKVSFVTFRRDEWEEKLRAKEEELVHREEALQAREAELLEKMR